MNKIFRYMAVAVAAVCSLSFAACSLESDDDDNTPVADVDVNEVVGTWLYDEASSSNKVTASVLGQEKDLSDKLGTSTNSVAAPLKGTIVCTADGNILSADSLQIGSYSIDGSDLTLSVTANGTTESLKKGETITSNGVTLTVKKSYVVVNGDVMTINMVLEGNMDSDALAAVTGVNLGSLANNVDLDYNVTVVYYRLK